MPAQRESERPVVVLRSVAPPEQIAVEEQFWFGSGSDHAAEERAANSMAARVGRVLGAKPFPEAARRLDQLTRGAACPINDVVRVLEGDPALSARLLRLVNSAGYALRLRCTSVRHAAVLVGTRRLNQLATTAAVLDMFEASTASAARVVEHAAVVGSLCRYLAAHFGLPRDELTTSGFLHDIGKLVLLDTEGEEYQRLLDEHGGTPDTVAAAEREVFGFDHAVLGAHVLAAWNIPEPVPRVVAWHHQPARAMQAGGMVGAMVQALRLADAIAYALDSMPKADAIAALASSEMASYLDLGEAQLAAMWTDLEGLQVVARSRGRNDPDPEVVPRRPSVEPKSIAPRTSEVPRQFPCGTCTKPSFGTTCAACCAYVCPEHWFAREQWCTDCLQRYRSLEGASALPIGLVAAVALTVGLSAGAGAAASDSSWLGAALVAVSSAGLAAALLLVYSRASRRIRFLRDRALARAEEAPVEPEQPDLVRIEIPRLPALPRLDVSASSVSPPPEPPPAFAAEPAVADAPARVEPPVTLPAGEPATPSARHAPLPECCESRPGLRGARCIPPSRWQRCLVAVSTDPRAELGYLPTEPPPPWVPREPEAPPARA